MTVRAIVEIGDPVLRQEARQLAPAEVRGPTSGNSSRISSTPCGPPTAPGSPPTQIGEPVQVCVIEVRPGNPRYPYKPPIPLTVLVNPVVEPLTRETFANYEGCLSVPGLRGVVDRCVEVRVEGSTGGGEPVDKWCAGSPPGRSSTRPTTSTGWCSSTASPTRGRCARGTSSACGTRPPSWSGSRDLVERFGC